MIYAEGGHTPQQAEHIAYWDPARVLAKCRVDREILGLHRLGTDPAWPSALMRVTRALASQWDDHPDYRPEWAVS